MTSPPSVNLVPDDLVAEPGTYSNIYYNKLIWSFPEFGGDPDYSLNNIWYDIYRESLSAPGSWDLIGSNQSRDNVFFDTAVSVITEVPGMISPNIIYTYRIQVNSDYGASPGYSPEASAKSPNFQKYTTITPGTTGWELSCGLGIYSGDDSGRPKIKTVGKDGPNNSNIVYIEMAEKNGNWITVRTANNLVGQWYGDINPSNSQITFNTEYSVRMTTRDVSGNITAQSNIVNITTYSLDSSSFPNMIPNSGLQYGFYDDILHPPSTPIPIVPTAVGTYERYEKNAPLISHGNAVSEIVATPVIISITGSGIASTTLDLISKKALKLVAMDGGSPGSTSDTNYTMNLSAYKFPANPILENVSGEQFGFSCRLVENMDWGPTSIIVDEINFAHSNGCRAEISRMTGNLTDNPPNFHVLIPSDDATRRSINKNDVMGTIAGTAELRGHLMTSVFNEPFDTGDGTHHQSQLQFRAKNYVFIGTPVEYPAVIEIYIGDMMLFDLTRIFGGNGADIFNVPITSEELKILVNAMNDWWDFDYVANTPDIPYEIHKADMGIDGVTISFQGDGSPSLHTVSDDNGGMDTTGYLPANNYNLQYKKVGTTYFNQKGPLIKTIDRLFNAELGTADSILDAGSMYQIRYVYTNSGGYSGFSTSTFAETVPYPDKVQNLKMDRVWDFGLSRTYFRLTWDIVPPVAQYSVMGYIVQFSTDNFITHSNNIIVANRVTTTTNVHTTSLGDILPTGANHSSPVYFCRIRAYNSLSAAADVRWSDVKSSVSVSLPTPPQNPSYTFTNINGNTTAVTYHWEPPANDGWYLPGSAVIVGYRIMHGVDINNLETNILGNVLEWTSTNGTNPYTINTGSSSYFKVAAITPYTNDVEDYMGGLWTDVIKVTFQVYKEPIKVRGIATDAGYIDFYFTKRTNDGSYVQFPDENGKAAFWRLTDHTAPISANANIVSIKSLIDEENSAPGTNVFRNGIVDAGTGYSPGWPLTSSNGPVEAISTDITNDVFGAALKITFTLTAYPISPDNAVAYWDVSTVMTSPPGSDSSIGLNGLGTFLVISDYTTDINFYTKNNNSVKLTDFSNTLSTTGSLIWTVNSSIVYNKYLNKNENTPLTSKEFYIPVYLGDSVEEIGTIISNGGRGVESLQDQMNNYFLGIPYGSVGTEIDPAISSIYADADAATPFIVSVEAINSDQSPDKKYHLKVHIMTTVEGIQNQITCRTSGLKAFYLATKANTYYVNDMMYELRSFTDMYGRNKPGSTTVYASDGAVKRSYGFKFNLDYIKEYQEDENSSIDVTPIPGSSSGASIGLDVMGTTRTISITGVRVDNSNYWMFHAPFEYIDTTSTHPTYGQIMQGGVIYMGTSNWGWCKFMKAIMGTFQFIDGPYRLIMMTIPSSLMQQYVPDRACKYQYPDGTYIVQAGTEDMCYVLVERFTTTKNDEMYNAIDYSLVLRRVMALGSST